MVDLSKYDLNLVLIKKLDGVILYIMWDLVVVIYWKWIYDFV